MQGVIIHGPRDVRIEAVATVMPRQGEVRVEVAAGGICGSDLHYFHNGGFGSVRLKEPMALGHEFAGTVAEIGEGVEHLASGCRVAVNPSLPCNQCRYCREGMRNQCLDMRFMGSAMRFPHTQGGFCQSVTVDASQVMPIPESLTMEEAAMAEPLAVCLHAARQAGTLMGKRVLVTGCGPIGALSIVVAAYSGAKEIVATDIGPFPLDMAERLGATHTIDMAKNPDGLRPFRAGKGYFDVLFEASGAEAALRAALEVIEPGGTIIQIGLGGDLNIPINLVATKELKLVGTFRFDSEFRLAIELMSAGRINVKPLLTSTLPFENAIEAFELASDRSRSMKVHLRF